MVKQTAMEQVIDLLEKRAKHMPPRSNVTIGLLNAISTLKQNLDLEREMIKESYLSGLNSEFENAEQHYNQTYKK